MQILKHFLYCFLLWMLCFLVACHLDEKPNKNTNQTTPTKSAKPTKTEESSVDNNSLIWSGSLDFTNAGKYRSFLRDSRRCDPCTHYIGPYSCENFDSRADLKIQFEKEEFPSKATLTIKTYYNGSRGSFFQGYLGACGFTVNFLSPIILKGTAKYWNDYEGFHVRFTGTNTGSIILRSQSTNPAGGYGNLEVTLYYGGSARETAEIGTAELGNPDIDNSEGGRTGGR